MNKAELVEKYSEEMGCPKAEAERAVDAVFNLAKQALKKRQLVKIAGFGTFAVVRRKARKGRNPSTGEEIRIPAKKKLAFKASKAFTEQLNS
jgi:DNA-binding protein HU-beta